MDWVLRSPQIHNTFGNLGFSHVDGYHINENCNSALESILHNILIEDKYLRTYRRSISFGQNLKKDLIPLLIYAKEDKTIELLIRILVNLTIPIECLLSVDVISKTDFGRHTVFEINNLLTSAKVAFTDHRVTKVVIEFLKKNFDVEQSAKLTVDQCTKINNSLLLLRNILHIPEEPGAAQGHVGHPHTLQNQILWNIFSQSIDKVIIKLMTIPEASNWGVTMVQLVALLYKDQHVVTLHKLLNQWLEASLSESSEDNESNTSPPDRGSGDSSPMLTSDPTSDSSDNGGSGKCNPENEAWGSRDAGPGAPPATPADSKQRGTQDDDNMSTTCGSGVQSESVSQAQSCGKGKKPAACETSDCGYGTQLENQGSVSTSSNEDEVPSKPVHQKPHNPKQRAAKTRQGAHVAPHDKKRKKIVKRAKANIINVQGLSHKTPTDDDISNILKEFTVDFLLKGYNSLVQTLHSQIMTNMQLKIDTSHFFWLVTYFLKFATQIELDLEHVCSVLSFDIVSYLTAEGVNLCEQFEMAIKLESIDLKPSIRRLHLVVTAIREYLQAIEVYKKLSHICNEDKAELIKLQLKVGALTELRSLLVLLLRNYNPRYHSKQYLQDLIVTNHILLLFVDSVMKLPEYNGPNDMSDHLKQFATPEVMHQYGLLLEDYAQNGEFVNDCIFTLMHHVGGELGSLISLFQPKILKTFTSIWETEFEICDDWSDLIEYVINTFIKKPHTLQMESNFRLNTESFEGDAEAEPAAIAPAAPAIAPAIAPASEVAQERWTKEELSTLNWNYMQCNTAADFIGDIVKMFKEDGITKSRYTIIKELYRQSIIDKEDYDKLMIMESDKSFKTFPITKEDRDDEIGKLCEQLIQDGKIKFLDWVQKVLLETCFVKIYLDKESPNAHMINSSSVDDQKIQHFELFKRKPNEIPVMSAVAYHCLLLNESVPLVPWNCAQASVAKDLKFLQLLQKMGFNMPVDTGKAFIRIPHFLTPDFLYDIAGKILPIDTSKLKFTVNDISDSGVHSSNSGVAPALAGFGKELGLVGPDNCYQIHKQNHHATMVNFTPMPISSFNSEERPTAEPTKENWLEVVQRSQELKVTLVPSDLVPADLPMVETEPGVVAPPVHSESEDNISMCDTASVASSLTHMYVSDVDEKPEALLPSAAAGEPEPHPRATKRPRVQFSDNF